MIDYLPLQFLPHEMKLPGGSFSLVLLSFSTHGLLECGKNSAFSESRRQNRIPKPWTSLIFFKVMAPLKQTVKYETVLWTLHATVTILAIVDRFTTNFWPRQSFTIGGGSAGNDRMDSFKEGPWSVVVYDILSRVSGRFSIVTFNFMLITR